MQIAEQFEALGAGIHVRCVALVGGVDMMAQAIALGKGVHVIVGTPGRVVDHLSNTKARARPSALRVLIWLLICLLIWACAFWQDFMAAAPAESVALPKVAGST